jgi:hypothetical protein
MARQVAFCRYGFLPPRLISPRWHAYSARSQVYREAYSYAPRGAILLPVMAGGARHGNSAVYVGAFCGSEEEGCQAPFQGYAEAGYRAKQDVRKTALCIDRARSIHKLIPVPGPAGNSPVGYCAEGAVGLALNLESGQGA